MPEIAEIARAVHFLRLHFVGKVIKHAEAIDDANVFGKVGTDGPKMAAGLIGKKIVSAGTQGKYFWMEMSKPPHLVMHFGMTGWIHIKGERTAYTNYYKKMKADEIDKWPPKYWKFKIVTKEGDEMAFTDPRRFGRVRAVECPGKEIRKHSPLVENGPDPVVDLDVFTEDYLREKMKSRKVPIKALLLDQAVISGIGNWVADEVLYQAKLHPEQYCNDFSDAEIKRLYENIRYVCQTAVDKLGDSDQFRNDWLFNYRWGKGSKNAHIHTPNGDKLAFITVGGRTSCYAPARQKKTGQVVSGIKEEPLESGNEKEAPKKAPRAKATKSKAESEEPKAEESDVKTERAASRKRNVKTEEDSEMTAPPKKAKTQSSKKSATSSQYFEDSKKPKRGTKAKEEPRSTPQDEDAREGCKAKQLERDTLLRLSPLSQDQILGPDHGNLKSLDPCYLDWLKAWVVWLIHFRQMIAVHPVPDSPRQYQCNGIPWLQLQIFRAAFQSDPGI